MFNPSLSKEEFSILRISPFSLSLSLPFLLFPLSGSRVVDYHRRLSIEQTDILRGHDSPGSRSAPSGNHTVFTGLEYGNRSIERARLVPRSWRMAEGEEEGGGAVHEEGTARFNRVEDKPSRSSRRRRRRSEIR